MPDRRPRQGLSHVVGDTGLPLIDHTIAGLLAHTAARLPDTLGPIERLANVRRASRPAEYPPTPLGRDLQPRGRPVRRPLGPPLPEGVLDRGLDRLFCEVEVAVAPRERPDQQTGLLADDLREQPVGGTHRETGARYSAFSNCE